MNVISSELFPSHFILSDLYPLITFSSSPFIPFFFCLSLSLFFTRNRFTSKQGHGPSFSTLSKNRDSISGQSPPIWFSSHIFFLKLFSKLSHSCFAPLQFYIFLFGEFKVIKFLGNREKVATLFSFPFAVSLLPRYRSFLSFPIFTGILFFFFDNWNLFAASAVSDLTLYIDSSRNIRYIIAFFFSFFFFPGKYQEGILRNSFMPLELSSAKTEIGVETERWLSCGNICTHWSRFWRVSFNIFLMRNHGNRYIKKCPI